MPAKELAHTELRLTTQPTDLDFETTAEIPANTKIIGQPRGTRAIEFGIGMQSDGFNMFILGPTGSGRTTAIKQFLEEKTNDQPVPDDWIYVQNFGVPHQPRIVRLPAGEGKTFQTMVAALLADLKRDLPQAFATDAYREAIETAQKGFEGQRRALMQAFQERAAEAGFALMSSPSGFLVAPVKDGHQLTPADMQQLTVAERQEMEETHQALTEELGEIVDQLHEAEMSTRQQIGEIERETAASAIQRHFEKLTDAYAEQQDILTYLEEMRADVLDRLQDFTQQKNDEQEIDLLRYEVNLMVDNSDTQGAPVILESNPTYHNLFGRIEYEMRNGFLTTHFTNIRCGSIHWANGGYLILDANDLLKHYDAWEALKRALKDKEISMQSAAQMDGSRVLAKSLAPEAIPLQVKIILMGSPELYYLLYSRDQDFHRLFKVRADFDWTMPYDAQHMREYAEFIATRCHEETLPHFDKSAVAKVLEFGAKLAGSQKKLSTQFGEITDLIREASFWAVKNGHDIVQASDVVQTLTERTYRGNWMEERIRERILENTIFIGTEGRVVGQVNGLSVLDMGEYAFGQPGRITARTFMGDDGIISIERETEMSGPIHEKGVLTLIGYLGGTYAQSQPLSLTASITFEQNYGGIDGDSASSTELYALLSSLSGVPIQQGIAVTGSVNQRGEVQPIGGVNEKIEGFFRVCAERGLTGEQGVLIPQSNVPDLMLHEDVITAVTEGQFHIWSVSHIDEGIELLTGKPAGTRQPDGSFPTDSIHHAVQTRLRTFAEELKSFSDNEN